MGRIAWESIDQSRLSRPGPRGESGNARLPTVGREGDGEGIGEVGTEQHTSGSVIPTGHTPVLWWVSEVEMDVLEDGS